MSVRALRSTFGPNCHWCGLPMDFDEPHGRPESATSFTVPSRPTA